MRIALGVFLLLHGFAHVVGFAVPWRLVREEQLPHKTTILAGRVDVGDTGIRVVGLLWLAAALAFAATGLAVIVSRPWAVGAVTWVAGASLVLSLLGWPDARIGVVVNAAILAGLALASFRGWV